MPVFVRIRLVLKFRHRPFRIFSNFEKIFIELGDTAPQSWTHFGKFQKIAESPRILSSLKLAVDQKWLKRGSRVRKKSVYVFRIVKIDVSN